MKLTCQEFYKMISKENDVLNKISSSAKYLKPISNKNETD